MSLATAQHPNINKQNQLPRTQHLSPSAVVAHNGLYKIENIKYKKQDNSPRVEGRRQREATEWLNV
jgi:hypothetical protein